MMQSVRLVSYVAEDGILQCQLPAQYANQQVEIMLIIQPVNLSPIIKKSNNFFEKTFGCFADDPIERPEQGEWVLS
jgi:hypothetical protein